MSKLDFWARFLLAILATWRVTHLLAKEDGPADLIARFRARLGSGFLGKLMDCFYCLSFWSAAVMAFSVSTQIGDWLLTWLALSGAACLLERLAPESIIIQPITKGEIIDGMLRSEKGGEEERVSASNEASRHAAST